MSLWRVGAQQGCRAEFRADGLPVEPGYFAVHPEPGQASVYSEWHAGEVPLLDLQR